MPDIPIAFHPPFFTDLVQPNGFLTRDMACHACWYFFMIADKARASVGKGPESQTLEYNATGSSSPMTADWPLWMDKHYNKQAQTVAKIYGLESPDEMWPFWPNVRMTARLHGVTVHEEYTQLKGQDYVS